ncbi:MAG: DUF3164 family protein [Oricola sp.]|nr:MAG: DUF3164 family protein [Oricola sp.]
MSEHHTEFTPAPIPDGVFERDGGKFMLDAKGVPQLVEFIKTEDLMEDALVRHELGFAVALSEQIDRFRAHVMDRLAEFDDDLAAKYGAKKGGKKGNRTYQTVDRLFKVEVKVADFLEFGPQLQVAKSLVDECLNEWTADGRPEARAIVTRAFNTDKKGTINRSAILMLMRLDFDDERWRQAMDAIRDAMRVFSSKEYVRFFRRNSINDPWQPITIDLAKAGA